MVGYGGGGPMNLSEKTWVRDWEDNFENRLRLMKRDHSVGDWTERAVDYSESRRTNKYEYGRKVLDTLLSHGVVGAGSRILEVGAGPGTFVIPFARAVKHVTAIEPSEGMAAQISANAAEAGIGNYDILKKLWQDVDVAQLAGKYELVISSTVIWMFKDILEQIRRMEQVSGGVCCIAAGANNGISQKSDNSEDSDNSEINKKSEKSLWNLIMGDVPGPVYPEYPYIYNILYENGRTPEVRMINYVSRRSVENVVTMNKVFYNLYTDITPEVENLIRNYVTERSNNGVYEMKLKSAVVWWKV